jgi:hypothetical protein
MLTILANPLRGEDGLEKGAREPDRAEEIDRHQRFPQGIVVGHERFDTVEARGVDDDLRDAVGGDDGVAQCRDRRGVGKTDHMGAGVFADGGDRVGQTRRIAVDGDDRRSCCAQPDGEARPIPDAAPVTIAVWSSSRTKPSYPPTDSASAPLSDAGPRKVNQIVDY